MIVIWDDAWSQSFRVWVQLALGFFAISVPAAEVREGSVAFPSCVLQDSYPGTFLEALPSFGMPHKMSRVQWASSGLDLRSENGLGWTLKSSFHSTPAMGGDTFYCLRVLQTQPGLGPCGDEAATASLSSVDSPESQLHFIPAFW